MQKGVSLFLLYTNMNKMNSLHHMKEYTKSSNFLQFESHSKSLKVRAIFADLRDLHGNNICALQIVAPNKLCPPIIIVIIIIIIIVMIIIIIVIMA